MTNVNVCVHTSHNNNNNNNDNKNNSGCVVACVCVCVCTVIYDSGIYTVLKFHVRLPVLQMLYVVGIHLMEQRWLLGMSRLNSVAVLLLST